MRVLLADATITKTLGQPDARSAARPVPCSGTRQRFLTGPVRAEGLPCSDQPCSGGRRPDRAAPRPAAAAG
jgi:hypothetical protein